jgi:hypothetical protein
MKEKDWHFETFLWDATFIRSFVKICSDYQKLMDGDRQSGDFISLFSFMEGSK